MAAKKKGTLARAQSTFLKALRDFEETIAGMVSSPSQTAEPKTKKAKARKGRTNKAKKTTKARR
jgi:hypothetical protein